MSTEHAGERVGAHQHRAPTPFDPGDMYFEAGILLMIAFGMCLIAVAEARINGKPFWAWFFMIMGAGCVVLYLAAVRWWIDFQDRTMD